MYWDSSALVPLLVEEDSSQRAQDWLSQDRRIVTWAWSRTEVVSAIERRVREGSFSRSKRREALEGLIEFSERWHEITDLLAVRLRANALLVRHALRTVDAGQLGAALLVNEHYPGTLSFVCLDQRLCLAAELENLRVLD